MNGPCPKHLSAILTIPLFLTGALVLLVRLMLEHCFIEPRPPLDFSNSTA